MDIRIFNVCMLVGWLMLLAGGVVIHPGWGIAIAGAVLLVGTFVAAYLAGLRDTPAAKPKRQDGAQPESAA